MGQYLYSSPTPTEDNEGYVRAPRTSFGRTSSPRIPYMNTRSVNGPNGEFDTTSYNNLPISQPAPTMSPDHALMLQNGGSLPRGPSGPGHNQAVYGKAGYGAPQMSGAPMSSPILSNTPSMPQFNGTMAGAPMSPQGQAQQARYNTAEMQQHAISEREYSQQVARTAQFLLQHHKASSPDEARSLAQAIHPQTGSPTTQPSAPQYGAPQQGGGFQTPVQQSAPSMPYTNPDTSSPQMRAPITDANRQNVHDSEYQAHRNEALSTMWHSYQNGLHADPNFNQAPVPPPMTGFNYTNTAARDAVNMGPEQAARNEGAIARGYSNQRNAVIAKNTANMADNQRGDQLADARLKSIGQGVKEDYNDPSAPVIAGRQGKQPAQAAAPTTQPSQPIASAQQPTGATHFSASTGTYWKQVNGQWQKVGQ